MSICLDFQRDRYSFGCVFLRKKKNNLTLLYLLQKLNKAVNIHVALSIVLYSLHIFYSLPIFCNTGHECVLMSP